MPLQNLLSELMPSVFKAEEFRKDYLLYRDLGPLAMQIAELSEARSTFFLHSPAKPKMAAAQS